MKRKKLWGALLGSVLSLAVICSAIPAYVWADEITEAESGQVAEENTPESMKETENETSMAAKEAGSEEGVTNENEGLLPGETEGEITTAADTEAGASSANESQTVDDQTSADESQTEDNQVTAYEDQSENQVSIQTNENGLTEASITISLNSTDTINLNDIIGATNADIYKLTFVVDNNHTYSWSKYSYDCQLGTYGQTIMTNDYNRLASYMTNNSGLEWDYSDRASFQLDLESDLSYLDINKSNTVELYLGVNRGISPLYWEAEISFYQADSRVIIYADEPAYLCYYEYLEDNVTRVPSYFVLNADGTHYFTKDKSMATVLEGRYEIDYLTSTTIYNYYLVGVDTNEERTFFVVPYEVRDNIRFPMYKVDAEWIYDFDINNIEEDKEYTIKLKVTNNNDTAMGSFQIRHGFDMYEAADKGWIASYDYLEYVNLPTGVSTENSYGTAYVDVLEPGESIVIEMKGTIPAIDTTVILGLAITGFDEWGNQNVIGTINERDGGLALTFTGNDVPSTTKVKLEDEKTGIVVESDSSILSEDTYLKVVELLEGQDEYAPVEKTVGTIDNVEKFQAYDIALYKEGDVKVAELSENVRVSIPVPEGYQAEACGILYVDDDGNVTSVLSYLEGEYLVFETDHFSVYAIAQYSQDETVDDPTDDAKENTSENTKTHNSQTTTTSGTTPTTASTTKTSTATTAATSSVATGDETQMVWWICALAAAIAGIAVIRRKKIIH